VGKITARQVKVIGFESLAPKTDNSPLIKGEGELELSSSGNREFKNQGST